jgi:biopolymer transport protein ExbD
MASYSNGSDDAITGINVTPLVDITLVLLIIFMVTATYIVKETIEVDLPRAAQGGETVGQTLAFVIDKAGTLYLDGQPVTPTPPAPRCGPRCGAAPRRAPSSARTRPSPTARWSTSSIS